MFQVRVPIDCNKGEGRGGRRGKVRQHIWDTKRNERRRPLHTYSHLQEESLEPEDLALVRLLEVVQVGGGQKVEADLGGGGGGNIIMRELQCLGGGQREGG